MCGIAGYRRFDGKPADEGLLRAMAKNLHHRGPDGEGFALLGRDRSVGFAHTRLSIIDLEGSKQPMTSAGGPVHLTYNGELFNYREMREELVQQGVQFATAGDTEVLLETLRLRGENGLQALDGQFAFAIFDERENGARPTNTDLWLARDRLGILPLYWLKHGEVFGFASEIKALVPLMEHLGLNRELDETAFERFLTYRSVPPNRTLYQSVQKLRPGHVLRVSDAGRVDEVRYWQVPAAEPTTPLSGQEAVEAVDKALTAAVASRLVSDVPVGAYLSGGVDSSLVTALVKKARNGGTVATYSAGFDDPRYDELPYARQVSEALGTDHHEIMVGAEDFMEHWQKLCWHRDGPISEPADVAIFKIATAARPDVKVLLSGEGADELFGGYPKHRYDRKLKAAWAMPAAMRVPMFRRIERMLPASKARGRIAARALTARSIDERMQMWFAPFTWYERKSMRPGFGDAFDPGQWSECEGDPLRRMLYVDCHTWLSDNLLERGDRMSMAASIENRPPFLAHDLVELAFNVASSAKVHGKTTKWVVKEIARRHLPQEIVDRKKVGFRVPLDEWFRGSMQEFVHDHLVGEGSIVSRLLDKKIVQRLLDDHRTGRRNEEIRLWTLLGFEVWHRQAKLSG